VIVYLATYPRSGNSWVQNLLLENFGRETTDIHARVRRDGRYDSGPRASTRRGGERTRATDPRPEELDDWFVPYVNPLRDGWTHRRLLRGCQDVLTRRHRKELAKSDEVYFLKTHHAPFERYFRGERVVQVVRNPGAALWSYAQFRLSMRGVQPPMTEFIRGSIGYGSWATYHEAWAEAAGRLRRRYVCWTYEEMFDNEPAICERLASFTGAPVLSWSRRSFDDYHAASPIQIRAGEATGWERHYSSGELHELWSRHRRMMEHFGYREPDYALALDASTD